MLNFLYIYFYEMCNLHYYVQLPQSIKGRGAVQSILMQIKANTYKKILRKNTTED